METHGHKRRSGQSKTYSIWSNMKKRCTNPRHSRYKDYGGRGITISTTWLLFENFLRDMGECPVGMQLDRKDNDGPYCKDNCKWSTPKENSRNKRNNVYLTYCGDTMTIVEWAERLGIAKGTLWVRKKNGWTDERIITTPLLTNGSGVPR